VSGRPAAERRFERVLKVRHAAECAIRFQ